MSRINRVYQALFNMQPRRNTNAFDSSPLVFCAYEQKIGLSGSKIILLVNTLGVMYNGIRLRTSSLSEENSSSYRWQTDDIDTGGREIPPRRPCS